MTFQEALQKALVEQKPSIKRKCWQPGVMIVISDGYLDLQHVTTCSIKGPKPYEYLKDDWTSCDFKN
jgi:hypothetical protein